MGDAEVAEHQVALDGVPRNKRLAGLTSPCTTPRWCTAVQRREQLGRTRLSARWASSGPRATTLA